MRSFTSIVFLLLALSACDSGDPNPAPAPDAVLLRVENASTRNFSSVTVEFPGSSARYGAVAEGRASPYREFETAYSYGAVTVEAAGKTYTLVPTDYVGEEPLADGRYTFVLDVEGANLRLVLRDE